MKQLFLFLSVVFCTIKCCTFTRYQSELEFMRCICGVRLDEREGKFDCMNVYTPMTNLFKVRKATQYCSNRAISTNFGEATRQKTRIMSYDPWSNDDDSNTEQMCSLTHIRPNEPIHGSLRKAVTRKGWLIATCILDTAQVNEHKAVEMIKECCADLDLYKK